MCAQLCGQTGSARVIESLIVHAGYVPSCPLPFSFTALLSQLSLMLPDKSFSGMPCHINATPRYSVVLHWTIKRIRLQQDI